MFEYTSKNGNKYRIDAVSDEDNVTLRKEMDVENFAPKEGSGSGRGISLGTSRKEFKDIGYFSSFKSAMVKLVDKLLSEGNDVTELKEILKTIETVLVPLAHVDQAKQYAEIRESLVTRKEENEKLRNGEEVLDENGAPKKRRGRIPGTKVKKKK